jgi:hypothetical protein
MTKIAGSGSGSGSISQRHGSADPDLDPNQNFMDPKHFPKVISKETFFWLLASHWRKKAGSGSVSQWNGSADSNPYRTGTVPYHGSTTLVLNRGQWYFFIRFML